MDEAIEIAKKGGKKGEVPVGALIVDRISGKILAKQHNLIECSKNPLAHAEVLAINQACDFVQEKFLYGKDLYVTLQPCTMCMHAIILSKISRVYFGAYDYESQLQIFNHNFIPEIYGGIKEDECSILLKNFFIARRKG